MSAYDPQRTSALIASIPGLMVADPPHGVAYDPARRHAAGINRSKQRGAVKNDDRADWAGAWALFPGAIAFSTECMCRRQVQTGMSPGGTDN